MGTQLPLPKKGASPQFSAHVCCGQMAAWTKMPLGMEVALGPSDFVLDGDQLPLPKKGAEPMFGRAAITLGVGLHSISSYFLNIL